MFVDLQLNRYKLSNMPPPIERILELLCEYTGLPLRTRSESEAGWDAKFEGPGVTFLIEYKTVAGAESVGAAVRRITARVPGKTWTVPLIVVPFMGEVGKALCKQAGVAWLDLSGNAMITTPRLRIAIDGKPNLYARRGRPGDPFAPKASRVSRVLLSDPAAAIAQRDVVSRTRLDKGFVSRTLRRLETGGFVERETGGTIRVSDPAKLLAAWRAAYDFQRHRIIRAVVAARSGPDLLQQVASSLHDAQLRFAATGLAAAWVYAPFATYRIATLYLEREPASATMKLLGAREMTAGANLWLVVPADDGVFDGAREVGGIPVVSPLQTYLDLAAQPERAEEAAEELRRVHLSWAEE
jgi:hypothetical protein